MSIPLSSAATPRPSNLTVPATQNTAPVVKFRCLFTHDIRRKAKRWQDGFLRYHTFNKRVMVYDNTGYFIGDLHWRAPDGIQDGDELELDKGVLIQVCEPLERTETDISSLYKNKPQPSPSRPGNAPPSSFRSTAPRPSLSSQQAPRSLNDLLGIKKTSTPQLLSPYEQRHAQRHANTDQLHERPAKRQRTSPERINRTSGQQDIVDLSDSPPPTQRSPRTQIYPDPPSKPHTLPTAALPVPRLPTDSSSASVLKQVQGPSSCPVAQSAPQNPKPASLGTESSINTLRLSGDRPRRKLMFLESSRAPLKNPETPPQLSRTNSQRQSTTKHGAASSPIIVLDDDDPVLDPSPTTTTQPTNTGPVRAQRTTISHQSKPARVDSNSALSITNLHNKNVEGGLNSTAIKNPSQDQFPRKSPISNNAIPLPRSGVSLPTAQHGAEALVNATIPRSTGLRKSLSDPTTIKSLHSRPLPTTSQLNPSTEKSEEQGPWTSEALDLFDFWPPGRPKPP